MSHKRRNLIVAGLPGALFAVVSAVAWACTGQSNITLLIDQAPTPIRAPATGQTVLPRMPVEIRWNHDGAPKLASGVSDANGAFSLEFAVPGDSPGVHYVVLTSGGERLAVAPFEITGPGGGPLQPDGSGGLWNGFSRSRSELAHPALTDAPVPRSRSIPIGIGLVAAGSVAAGSAIVMIRKATRS